MKKISLVLLSFVFILTGCSSGTAEEARDTFVVGMECAYAPYNWTESQASDTNVPIEGGQYCEGYDVQIAKRVANEMGKDLVIQKTKWEGLILSLQTGQLDAIIAGMSPTPERMKEINFSSAYYLDDEIQFGIVVKSDGNHADASTINDFEGSRVAAQVGTFHPDLAKQLTNVGKVEGMQDFATMTLALQSGEIDAFVSDNATGEMINTDHTDIKYIQLDGPDGYTITENMAGVGIGINKENTQLLNEVNNALSTISREEQMELMDIAVNSGDFTSGNFFTQVAKIFKENWKSFAKGTMTTLLISLSATVIGFLLGLLVAISRHNKILNVIANIYITVFRGTPMMVQAMVMYYGASLAFPGFSWNAIPLGNILAGIIVVSINTGAYMSETIRSGIQAIDKGQFEAAQSMGYTHWETMRYIILPQAIKNVIPAIGNEFIVNIKDTSVLNVISVTELFFISNGIAASNLLILQTFMITSAIYLTLTVIISFILSKIELHLDKTKEVASSYPASVTDAKHVNVKGEIQ